MATSKLIATLHSGEETTSGESDAVDITKRSLADLKLVVSALTGAASVALQSSPDGETWRTVATKVLTTGLVHGLQAIKLDRYVRLAWTIEAAAVASFDVSGSFHNVYAYLADMDESVMPKKFVNGNDERQHFNTLKQASDVVDTELCGACIPPIVDWGASITLYCSQVLAHLMASKRGYNPEGADKIILENYRGAMSWLGKVSKGARKPPDIVDSTPDKFEGAGLVVTGERREEVKF